MKKQFLFFLLASVSLINATKKDLLPQTTINDFEFTSQKFEFTSQKKSHSTSNSDLENFALLQAHLNPIKPANIFSISDPSLFYSYLNFHRQLTQKKLSNKK